MKGYYYPKNNICNEIYLYLLNCSQESSFLYKKGILVKHCKIANLKVNYKKSLKCHFYEILYNSLRIINYKFIALMTLFTLNMQSFVILYIMIIINFVFHMLLITNYI